MARISRFKLRDSDRSGFTFKERSLVKDGAWKVGGDELDAPPPSKVSLGGEGDINAGAALTANDFQIGDLATPAAYDNPTNYITAAGGIVASRVHPWMYVVGSLSNVSITINPQISAGREGQQLVLVGVGSTVTLSHSTGLNMVGSAPFRVDSGSIIVLMYNTSNNLWNERSRTRP